MDEFWRAPKPQIYIPINIWGSDDEPFQTCAPEEMTREEAEKRNIDLMKMGSTWEWFCWAEMGSA